MKHVVHVIVAAVMLALPTAARAQEATLSGTVSDTQGGVLPGVTITATNEESGNTFLAVTDGAGAFRTGGVKLDTQFTPATRLSIRMTKYHQFIPGSGGGATTHPSAATRVDRYSPQTWVQLTHVMSTRAINEIKGGYYGNKNDIRSLVSWAGGAMPTTRIKGPPTRFTPTARRGTR